MKFIWLIKQKNFLKDSNQMTPDKFAERMSRLANNITANSEKVCQRASLAITEQIISATPVDTGKAMSNWQVSLNYPILTNINPYAAGKSGSTYSTNRDAAIGKARAIIKQYRSGAEIHICNALPYISRLNDGYSDQAPAAFVQTALQAGASKVRGAKLLVDSSLKVVGGI